MILDTSLPIAVLMGGPGNERQVSLASGKAVLESLRNAGYNATPIDVTSREIHLPKNTALAFNLIHGTFGEDGDLQQQLENLGIPYTGAGITSSRIAFDKTKAKIQFLAKNVPTPPSEILDTTNGPILPSFPPPFVVKPPREGSSVGVHIVKSQQEATQAITEAASLSPDLLVEKFIQGRELTVAILNNTPLPIIEIVAPDGNYDYKNKYPSLSGAIGSQYFCPANLDEETTARVQAAALAAHQALGIEIYSRVDVLLDANNQPFVLEANTIPGMTETSLLPKAAAAAGMSFTELCLKIADLSYRLRA